MMGIMEPWSGHTNLNFFSSSLNQIETARFRNFGGWENEDTGARTGRIGRAS